MRKSRFTNEQRSCGRPDRVAKRHGISEQTIYTWRKPFVTTLLRLYSPLEIFLHKRVAAERDRIGPVIFKDSPGADKESNWVLLQTARSIW